MNPLTFALSRLGMFWDDLHQLRADLLAAIERANRELVESFDEGD